MDFFGLSATYCDIMNSTYHLRVNHTSFRQTVQSLNHTHLNRMNLTRGHWIDNYTINAPDTGQLIDSVALYSPLINMIKGKFEPNTHNGVVSKSLIYYIRTLTERNNETGKTISGESEIAQPYRPSTDMRLKLEELSRNITISLLAEPLLSITNTTRTTCRTSYTRPVWVYNPIALLPPYIGGIVVTGIGLLLSACILAAEGTFRDLSFSTILRTSRATTIDQLVKNQESGSAPLVKDIAKARLKFGALRSGDGSGRVMLGLGRPNEILDP